MSSFDRITSDPPPASPGATMGPSRQAPCYNSVFRNSAASTSTPKVPAHSGGRLQGNQVARKSSGIDRDIARCIDHTILRPDATADDIRKICAEARQYGFASACVNPYWVPLVAAELAGSPVKVCTVVGFPLGASATEMKAAETEAAVH